MSYIKFQIVVVMQQWILNSIVVCKFPELVGLAKTVMSINGFRVVLDQHPNVIQNPSRVTTGLF